jgi:putative ATPase
VLRLELSPEAEEAIVQLASGDARKALTLLELASEDARSKGSAVLELKNIEAVAQRKVLLYDRHGEEHFNLVSALHKSLRESDPDAALYWLARMWEAGEDPNYLARRLVRFAIEDVGLADPLAVVRAIAAWEVYERLGSPEGDLAFAQLTIDLALSPKSVSSYRAWSAARQAVRELPAEPVPLSIRNASTPLLKELGYGTGYVYAPDTEEGVAGLECLPPSLRGKRFYEPSQAGSEVKLAERLAEIRALRRKLQIENKKK